MVVCILRIELEVFWKQVLIAHCNHDLRIQEHLFKLVKCQYGLESQYLLFKSCDTDLLVFAFTYHIEYVFTALDKSTL
jgi:hypothetical protein